MLAWVGLIGPKRREWIWEQGLRHWVLRRWRRWSKRSISKHQLQVCERTTQARRSYIKCKFNRLVSARKKLINRRSSSKNLNSKRGKKDMRNWFKMIAHWDNYRILRRKKLRNRSRLILKLFKNRRKKLVNLYFLFKTTLLTKDQRFKKDSQKGNRRNWIEVW